MLAFINGSTVFERKVPIAVPMADPAYGVIGSVIRLNGQSSVDPEPVEGRSGSDGVTTATTGNTISALSGAFSGVDYGRIIRIDGADRGSYLISGILSDSEVVVTRPDGGGVNLGSSSSLSWSIDDFFTYSWRFISVPIGSRVVIEGFRPLYPDLSLVSFSPDVVGEYVVGLTVSNAVHSSVEVTTRVSIRAILVPHGRGLVPDGKFIWSYIRDVWQEVANKEVFETFWSALIQICGAELLKLYQADFNKSIRDIQELYQRRWLSYEPKLNLVEADCTFYLGNSAAGSGGTSKPLALSGQAVVASSGEVIVVSGSVLPDVYGATFRIVMDVMAPGNVGSYPLQGANLSKTGYLLALDPPSVPGPNPLPGKVVSGLQFVFDAHSTSWTMGTEEADGGSYTLGIVEGTTPLDWLTEIYSGSGGGSVIPVYVGDVIYYPSGLNAGYYRVVEKSGSYVVVDHASTVASEVGVMADVYRPVEYELLPAEALPETVSSFALPYEGNEVVTPLASGRVITVGGRAYPVLRVFMDETQGVSMVVVVTDGGALLVGQVGMPWRVANTLESSSQNFEELGVSPGDRIEFDVTNDNANLISSVPGQVVGVVGKRLSFVLTIAPLTDGVVPAIPKETYQKLASDFVVSGVSELQDGTLKFSGAAAAVLDTIGSELFHRSYWNTPLTSTTDFKILNGVFHVHPKFIIRNSRVPVDDSLRSVPVLQDWVVQPTTTTRAGKTYQLKNEKEYLLSTPPVSLIENSDFLVDGELAFSGSMTFDSGTDLMLVETGHFLNRGVQAGDTVEIASPASLAGSYTVLSVLSNFLLKLNRPIPKYVISTQVTARLVIRRRTGGRYIRFIPGEFTAAAPAPNRLWAEVSLFDNRPSIEDNFGILVGLTQSDLEAVSTNINYRQAVAGLMFAYTRGSAISKIRLGAQILLGLPFAEHRGIIRSIEGDYRLDDEGTPTLGRLLIEDTDQAGKALGTMRVYTFPVDPISDLAGLEVNPATGKFYAVGDSVEAFAALCKGVEVTDYLTRTESNLSGPAILRQFHTARLRANDSIFDINELSLLSAFLKRITPSYVSLVITTASEFRDAVSITDATYRRLASGSSSSSFIVDQVAMKVPIVPKFDLVDFSGNYVSFFDAGMAWMRFSRSSSLTTSGDVASYAPGGFLTSTSNDGPVVRVGDTLLIYSGLNQGTYSITAVTDSSVTVSGLPSAGFEIATQGFAILRYPTGEVRRGTCISDGAGTVTAEAGLHADGVAPGDTFITQDGFRAVVLDVGPHADAYDGVGGLTSALGNGMMRVSPAIPAGTGKSYRIYRESFLQAPYPDDSGVLHSTGSGYTSLNNVFLKALLNVGDELQVQGPSLQRVTVLDPVNLVIIPVLSAGDYTVLLCRKNGMGGPISWDHVAKFAPQDSADIALFEPQSIASCTGGSAVVNLVQERTTSSALGTTSPPASVDTSLAKPGDFVILLSGANSTVDVGYGLGVYPVKEVTPTNVKVTTMMANSGTSSWKLLRRR
jgi:hypothetical protein